MPSDAVKFTLRTEPELLKKFRFVAEYNARSANRELEVLMKNTLRILKRLMEKLKLNRHHIIHFNPKKETAIYQ